MASNKKVVIEHLNKAIAKMRHHRGDNGGKTQIERVVETLKRDYSVSVSDSQYKTIGRRIREFNAEQN